ncbi:hypothetical protein AKJ65_01710 [candidate division MSBL1 archaeon SCGC-AAA259E19]|uniref:Uncharacterized protein n=1 Tax=candidate division MSBL1 archaeon SCGC-AAA259E19 TaxID=1698264 RepID=A0A133UMI4_9EURY|nr:hypothetical protein AKJ65_01710 [candidate division MSBL1 archaeon SCGC-AAA259E19]
MTNILNIALNRGKKVIDERSSGFRELPAPRKEGCEKGSTPVVTNPPENPTLPDATHERKFFDGTHNLNNREKNEKRNLLLLGERN